MMIVGTLPFNDINESNTVFRILDVKYPVPEWASSGFCDLVARVLVRCARAMTQCCRARRRDMEQRLTGEDVAAHAWLASLDGSSDASVRPAALSRRHPPPQWLASLRTPAALPELTAEQHEAVLTTMTRNSMDRKEILEALAANHYDAITSTYYLLAQREVGRRMRLLRSPRCAAATGNQSSNRRRRCE